MQDGLLYSRYTRKEDIVRGRASNVPTPVKSGSLPVTERVVIQPASVVVPEPVAQSPPPAAVEPKSPIEVQAAPAAEAQGTEGKTEKKRKPRWTEEQKEAAKAARAAAKKDKKKKKKKKKKSKSKSKSGDDSDDEKDAEPAPPKKIKLIPLEPEDRVSGPANTDEAQRMRSALGFAPAPEAVAVPAQPAVHDGGFSFGFQPAAAAAAETPRAFAALVQEQPAPKTVSSSSDDSSSSSSSDDSSSEDEAGPRRAAPAAPAAPAPVTPAPAAGLAEAGGEQLVPRRVYIGGMPYRYTREQLEEYWSYCGEIESMEMMTFPDTGRFKGIVFVTFATEAGYESALSFDGSDCDGQTVKVKPCKAPTVRRSPQSFGAAPAQPPAAERAADAAPEPPAAAWQQSPGFGQGANWHKEHAGSDWDAVSFVTKNLRTSTSYEAKKVAGVNSAYVGNLAYEATVEDLENLFAPFNVTHVVLHTDKETGKPRGFAHVHFRDEASLDQAITMNGTHLRGRPLRVSYGQAKKPKVSAFQAAALQLAEGLGD